MSTLEKAVAIAAEAHAGIKDRQGVAYLLHPLRVMLGVTTGEETQIVAVLHDVVEDTAVTIADIRDAGFSNAVLEALDRVTHHSDVSYAEYVIGCKPNSIAREVKLADLRDNARLDRALLRPEKFASDTARVQRYLLSYRYLIDELSEAEYRSSMQVAQQP